MTSAVGEPTPASRPKSDLALFQRLLRHARGYWPHIAAIVVLSVMAAPLALLVPLPLKVAVDSVIGSHPVPDLLDSVLPAVATGSKTALLVTAAAMLIGINLLVYVRALASWLLETYTGEKLALAFRTDLFGHVQRLSLSYHDMRGVTDSAYRIQYDAPSIQWILINGVAPFITAACTLLGMLFVTFTIDWVLAVIALVVAPVLFVLARASSRRLRKRWYEVKALQSSAMSVVQEVLAAVRVVKAFGQEERERARFAGHASESVKGEVRLAFIQGGFDLLVGLAIAAGTASVLVVGVLHVESGVLTLGALLIVMAYLLQIYAPMETIARKMAELQASLASADRAFALLDEAHDVMERPDARPLSRARGAVAFRNMSFAYGDQRPVLGNVAFEVGPGTRVGIVGTTGAGKTTLAGLLTRFYDPSEGQILLDGVDLRDYRLSDLRNQFAIVLQEPVLFSTSIAENIAYARPGASKAEIITAAKAACCDEFIRELPQRYDTEVGERGMRLSGGERQRIALARAFLKDAPILILDEPTSAVDTTTETAIVEALERLMRGRTTFMIAHRLSTLRNCDLILAIEDGRLVSQAPAALTRK